MIILMAYSLTWLKAQFGKLGLSRHGMYAPDGIVITASLLTIYTMGCATREYTMGCANVICDTRIRYGPRECDTRYAIREYAVGRAKAIRDTRYANTLWAARMRYAIHEYAMGRANAICETRMGRANAICE